jgi:adenosylcobinamide-GDP ribazoletransferase
VVSRTWPLLLIRLLPHVGDAAGSKSKPLADQIQGRSLLAAFLWCFMALALVLIAQAATYFIAVSVSAGNATNAVPVAGEAAVLLFALGAALGASALAFVLMWRWFAARLQGFTGDCLGATQQICEITFYLGLALGLGAAQ